MGNVSLWILMFIPLLFVGLPTQARVFDLRSEGFGTYLRTSYASAVPGTETFGSSSGADMTFNDRFRSLTSYDIGMIFASKLLSLRAGIEVFQPPELKGILGASSSGLALYSFDSSVSGYTLKGGLEGNLMTGKTNRFGFISEAGLVNLTIQNSYKFTAAGAAQFGLSDFREEVTGTTLMISGGFIYEFLLSDTTTLFFDGGYRSLNAVALKHNLAITGFQGPVEKGDAATNNDRITKRSANLSGIYFAAGFRFWL